MQLWLQTDFWKSQNKIYYRYMLPVCIIGFAKALLAAKVPKTAADCDAADPRGTL